MSRESLPFVIELEGDRHVERIVSGSFPEREEFAVERLQFVYLIIIRSLEIGGADCAEVRVVLFRHFGAEEQTAVLRHANQWLSDGHVVPSFTSILFT